MQVVQFLMLFRTHIQLTATISIRNYVIGDMDGDNEITNLDKVRSSNFIVLCVSIHI